MAWQMPATQSRVLQSRFFFSVLKKPCNLCGRVNLQVRVVSALAIFFRLGVFMDIYIIFGIATYSIISLLVAFLYIFK